MKSSRLATRSTVAGILLMSALNGGCGCGTSGPSLPADIGLQLVVDGLTSPVALVEPPDGTGRLFVVDQTGQIRVIGGGGALLETPFLDLASRMVTLGFYDERGLLGLAFHPEYASTGRLFVFYSAPKGGGVPAEWDSEMHLSEFRVSGSDANICDADSEQVLLRIPKPQANHNGGQLLFGPDGYLYIGIGDGGAAGDFGVGHTEGLGNSQDKSKLLGKILRIDVDSASPYGIPPDNPFAGESGAAPEIYALGFRNPWKFSFDAGDDQLLLAADVGQSLFEEVDIVEKGGNYGWRVREGQSCFDPQNPGNPPAGCAMTSADGQPLIEPILVYPHEAADGQPAGISVIGGFVYRGSAVAGLSGRYVFGDYSRSFLFGDGSIFVAERGVDGEWSMRELGIAGRTNGRLGRFIFGFGEDRAGEIYLLSSSNIGPTGETGQVHRIISP